MPVEFEVSNEIVSLLFGEKNSYVKNSLRSSDLFH